MIQISSRLIFRHLKTFNYSIFKSFYTYIFKQQPFENRLCCKYKNFYLQKYLVTSTSPYAKRKLVSNIEDLKEYIGKDKQFYLKLLVNILDNIQFDNLSSEDAKLLFTCCGNFVVDSSKQARHQVCQSIFDKLYNSNKLDLDICHTYIEVCTENHILMNCKDFLSQLKFEPNHETYKLLLNNVCEKGNIEQALELLEIMKSRGISVNDQMFNKLVLAHTIQGGSKGGETVLRTMKTAQIPETTETRFSLLKGVLQRDNIEDVDYVLTRYPVQLTEKQFLVLLEILGLNGNISWLKKIKYLYTETDITRDYINALAKVCIHLVHMNRAECAMTIYEEFVEPEKDPNYGFFILKEMLHCNVDISRIIELCTHLQRTNLNNYAVEKLAEIALRNDYTEASWKLLENMSTLRSHFFWPLLLSAGRKEGEIGVFRVLQKMIDMNVTIDSETLQFYVLPFCITDDLQLLIKKLKNLKITVKEAVNSLLVVLLQNKNVQQAAELCTIYDVNIYEEKLFRLISSLWVTSKDSKSVVTILQKFCESNYSKNNLVSDFLMETLNFCKNEKDFLHYIKLLELIHERKLRIDAAAADILRRLSLKCNNPEVSEKIKDGVDTLLDFDLTSEPVYIPHPRNMTIDELECHLLELREKNMETRGVLRKLIQLHSNLGHSERVNELRKQFLSSGYEESVGMKSSLMHSHIKQGLLKEALNIYNEIKIVNPHFKIDSFKIIDLATLLVKEGKYGEAMDILKTETGTRKVAGGRAIERNCWQLLNSFEDVEEQLNMFKFLVENGYCKPTNVIFGPLIRIHLKRGDLQKSASIYINCASDYKCTPLQLELLKEILKAKDDVLLQSVIEATEKVHGLVPTQAVLIAALAENGQEKALQKLFAENKLNIKGELEKRCNRWVEEGKVEALQTLARACERFSKEVFDINFIYDCIIRAYSLNNDYKSASEFYEQLLNNDVVLDTQIEQRLKKLKNCNLKQNINNM